MNNRAFTIKSLVFGLIGLLIVCTLPAFSESVLRFPGTNSGYLPAIPLFLIVVLSLGWNMTVGRWVRRLALGTRELAVIFAFMIIVSWVPGLQGALVRYLVLPRYEELTTNKIWKEAGVTTRLPDTLFPHAANGEAIGEKVHFGFIQGGVALKDIPYQEWFSPLLHWMPLLLVLSFSLLALAFLVHRQWSVHEQLRYPLAEVADALIEQDDTRPGGRLFRNRLFWAGFSFVFLYLNWRYLNAWFPGAIPNIPSEYSLSWKSLFPAIEPSGAAIFNLAWIPVSLAIIGIAYLVPTDVSLSIGLTAPLGTLLGIQYYVISGNPVSSTDLDVFRAGGFIAFGLILLYTGRAYYFPLLLKAIVPVRNAGVADSGAVWAARLFLVGYLLLIAICRAMGVDWLIAWIIVTFMLLIFLVVARLVCETGVPGISAGWSLPGLLSGLFGPAALGATPVIFIMLLSNTIVMAGSTQLIMPHMATSLKLLDDNKISLPRFIMVAKAAIVVALVAGFIAVLTFSYSNGGGNLLRGERAQVTAAVRDVLSLKDFGRAEISETARGFAKIPLMKADSGTVTLVVGGLIAVILTYALRFRFSKWPLHPLFFLIIGSDVGKNTWFCFLLGWAIKSLVVKLGGGRIYRDLKPLFIGLVVGQMFSMGQMVVISLVYYLNTGNIPVPTGLF